jgi:hypothetical protein
MFMFMFTQRQHDHEPEHEHETALASSYQRLSAACCICMALLRVKSHRTQGSPTDRPMSKFAGSPPKFNTETTKEPHVE